MSLNVPLLRSSFDLVVERQPELTKQFYGILFERYPQVKPLFGGNSGGQQQAMLQETLIAVIDRLDDASWLTDKLGALGKKHLDYGVTSEMYAWVGDSLLTTLEDVAGDAWTPELKQAWTDAYDAIQSLMMPAEAKATAA